MKRFIEDVNRLCEQHTTLTEEDIEIIKNETSRLPQIAEAENRDVFINVACSNSEETVTVALAHCDDTLYEQVTVGFLIRDEDEPAVLRTLRYGISTTDMWAVSYTTTEGHKVVQYIYPIKNGDRTIAALTKERRLSSVEYQSLERIDERIPIDYAKHPYLKHLDSLACCIDDAVIVTDEEGIVVFRNARAISLYKEYGYMYDVYGKDYNQISMHGPLVVRPDSAEPSHECEIKSSGHYYQVKECCYTDKAPFYVIVISDVTRERLQEENLVLKSVALREAHHRIKNNLQTIYNLLDMQKRRISNHEANIALQETMGRVISIAATYETLLMSGLDDVNIIDVLKNVKDKILQIVGAASPSINVIVEGDDVLVTADIATDLAMIANELIQNSFKYAFAGRDSGIIKITIKEGALYSVMRVADNGIGIKDESMESAKKEPGKTGLGFQISKSLVRGKLKGSFRINSSDEGTTIDIEFKNTLNRYYNI